MIRYHSRNPSTHRALRLFALLLAVAMLGISAAGNALADTPRIYAVRLDGVINSLSANRAIQTVRQAESAHASAVLIEINSPGGTESSVQQITRTLLSSTVPIVVYVGSGQKAEALSGALFITLAANVAAMKPDANLGAGNPESLVDAASGSPQQTRLSQIIQFATNTASARQRNVDSVTQLIQKNSTLSADEAVSQGIIDRVTPTLDQLLTRIDGTEVQTLAGPRTIQTDNARLLWQNATWHELILEKITDPNVAYILFSLGALLLVIELFNPGRLIAGIPGIISLAAAFVAFGNMPVSWVGVGLMAGGFLLFIRELFTPKLTIIGPIGVALFVAGSFTLYRPVSQSSAIVPSVGVSLWIIASTTLVLIVVLLLMMRAIFRVRHGMVPANASWLVGADGVVLQALQPRGVIRVRGQEWTAVTVGKPAREGDHVRVDSVSAGVLHVTPSDQDADLLDDVGGNRLGTPGSAS